MMERADLRGGGRTSSRAPTTQKFVWQPACSPATSPAATASSPSCRRAPAGSTPTIYPCRDSVGRLQAVGDRARERAGRPFGNYSQLKVGSMWRRATSTAHIDTAAVPGPAAPAPIDRIVELCRRSALNSGGIVRNSLARTACAVVAQLVRAPDCGSGGRWVSSPPNRTISHRRSPPLRAIPFQQRSLIACRVSPARFGGRKVIMARTSFFLRLHGQVRALARSARARTRRFAPADLPSHAGARKASSSPPSI